MSVEQLDKYRELQQIDDEEQLLLLLVKQHNQEAFRQLYSKYVGQVYALCFRLTGTRQMAEEATQEVFLQVWRKLGEFEGKSKFSTWLHRLASNITISYLRKQASWLNKFKSAEIDTPELEAQSSPDLNRLDGLIRRLPERARIVFVLHGIEGYRHEDVAQAMNTSVGNSKAQFHRAKKLLKTWLENES